MRAGGGLVSVWAAASGTCVPTTGTDVPSSWQSCAKPVSPGHVAGPCGFFWLVGRHLLADEFSDSPRSMFRELSKLWKALGVTDRAHAMHKAAAEGLLD